MAVSSSGMPVKEESAKAFWSSPKGKTRQEFCCHSGHACHGKGFFVQGSEHNKNHRLYDGSLLWSFIRLESAGVGDVSVPSDD